MKDIREMVEKLIQWSCEYPNRHEAYTMLMKLDRMLDAIGRDPDAADTATANRINALECAVDGLKGKLGRRQYRPKPVLDDHDDRIKALESTLEAISIVAKKGAPL